MTRLLRLRRAKAQPGEEGKSHAPVPTSSPAVCPLAFALAHALTLEESGAGYPLPMRLAWASFLRRHEPDPAEVQKAALKAHLSGLMHAGKLTPDGVRAALSLLSEDLTPPLLNPAHVGKVD